MSSPWSCFCTAIWDLGFRLWWLTSNFRVLIHKDRLFFMSSRWLATPWGHSQNQIILKTGPAFWLTELRNYMFTTTKWGRSSKHPSQKCSYRLSGNEWNFSSYERNFTPNMFGEHFWREIARNDVKLRETCSVNMLDKHFHRAISPTCWGSSMYAVTVF